MTKDRRAPPRSADPASLIESLQGVWRDQLALCDALEHLADGLPHHVDRSGCLRIARAIPPLLQKAHRLEETTLFPLLELSTRPAPDDRSLAIRAPGGRILCGRTSRCSDCSWKGNGQAFSGNAGLYAEIVL